MNIVSFSGGKDSTAMLLMMLEKGITQEVTQSINSCLRYRPIGSSEDFKPLPERECEG